MGSIKWDDGSLKAAMADAAQGAVRDRTSAIESAANLMGSGFRTGIYHRDHKSPGVGDTAPRYESNVEEHGGIPVGMVYTGNYAAMVDNHRSNTLLKARG